MSTVLVKDSIETLDKRDIHQQLHVQEKKGKLIKGSIFANGSVPTIPSRYFTVITNNSDQKGFQRTSKRFQNNFSDTPGPGSYVSIEDVREKLKKPSDSKKGYGGFASSSSRNEIKFNPLITPGAGSYELKILNNRHDFSTSNTSSFQKPIAKKLNKEADLPAPNSYDPTKAAKLKYKSNNVVADSAFKSQTKRELVDLDKVKDLPAPNSYDVKDDLRHESTKVPFSSFKSSSNRRSFTPYNTNPGPGDYNPGEPVDDENVNRQLFPRRHYLAISAPAIPMAPELPLPGPGAYNVRDFKEPNKKYMSSAVFVSSTSRWFTGHNATQLNPGPSNYSPQTLAKQSFHYNHDKKWI